VRYGMGDAEWWAGSGGEAKIDFFVLLSLLVAFLLAAPPAVDGHGLLHPALSSISLYCIRTPCRSSLFVICLERKSSYAEGLTAIR
jgi:hypothetical protein